MNRGGMYVLYDADEDSTRLPHLHLAAISVMSSACS